METKIIIVRHGQSESNKQSIFAGQTQFPLTELGLRQAQLVKNALIDENVDAIYSSPLQRAYDTILPLAQAKGLSITTDDGFAEMNFGEWENVHKNVLINNYPKFIEWTKNPAVVNAQGAETIQEAANRFYCALENIVKEREGQTIVVASHGEIIMLFLCKIGYFDQTKTTCDDIPSNASITTLTYDGKFRVESFSNKQHLGTFTCGLNLA